MNYAKRHNSSDDIFPNLFKKSHIIQEHHHPKYTTQPTVRQKTFAKSFMVFCKLTWPCHHSWRIRFPEAKSPFPSLLVRFPGLHTYKVSQGFRNVHIFQENLIARVLAITPNQKMIKKILMKISKIHFFLGHPVLGKYIHVIWGT